MINFRKNHELFWILEVLLLTPVSFLWMGVLSLMLSDSNSLLYAVIGKPIDLSRALFISVACPLAAVGFAYKYLLDNKKEKGAANGTARIIIWIGTISIVMIALYVYSPRV